MAAAQAAKPVRGDAVSAAARFGAFRKAALPIKSDGPPTTDFTSDASSVTEKDSR